MQKEEVRNTGTAIIETVRATGTAILTSISGSYEHTMSAIEANLKASQDAANAATAAQAAAEGAQTASLATKEVVDRVDVKVTAAQVARGRGGGSMGTASTCLLAIDNPPTLQIDDLRAAFRNDLQAALGGCEGAPCLAADEVASLAASLSKFPELKDAVLKLTSLLEVRSY